MPEAKESPLDTLSPEVLDSYTERFIQLVAAGMEPPAAYAEAGFDGPCGTSAVINSNRLLERPEVKKKIEDIRNARPVINKDWVRNQLYETYSIARLTGNLQIAKAMIELIGKDKGMFIDKKKIEMTRSLSDLSDEELEAIIASEDANNETTP